MEPTTPAKRRALAPLNANAMSPAPKLGLKPTQQQAGAGRSPTKPMSGLKRAFQVSDDSENIVAKKQCPAPAEPARAVSVDRTAPSRATPAAAGPSRPEEVRAFSENLSVAKISL